MKILKVVIPVIILFYLFKTSYISLEPLKDLLKEGNIISLIFIFLISTIHSIAIYTRFFICLKSYKINAKINKFFLINSQAYAFASFIPGQIGIDAWRIGKLRRLDKTKYKTELLKASILEKVFALISQVFILGLFLFNNILIRLVTISAFIFFVYIILFFLNKISSKSKKINKYLSKISYKDISKLLIFSIICGFISCYSIYIIAISLNMQYSFPVLSFSSTISNMSSIIPITPNGIGVSEFVFSEVTRNITEISNVESISTIYFSYRILNLLSHFGIYYILKFIVLKNRSKC